MRIRLRSLRKHVNRCPGALVMVAAALKQGTIQATPSSAILATGSFGRQVAVDDGWQSVFQGDVGVTLHSKTYYIHAVQQWRMNTVLVSELAFSTIPIEFFHLLVFSLFYMLQAGDPLQNCHGSFGPAGDLVRPDQLFLWGKGSGPGHCPSRSPSP